MTLQAAGSMGIYKGGERERKHSGFQKSQRKAEAEVLLGSCLSLHFCNVAQIMTQELE